jgi:tellurite resistance protein
MNDVVGLRKYGRALEESFFELENQKLLAKLREQAARENKRDTLREALKIDDEKALDHLVELDLTPETIVAFSLVPLVEVAWADGEIQDKEREAILRAAKERGITSGSASHALLDNWLRRQPPAVLLETWRHYAKALLAVLGPDEKRLMRESMIGNARAVAEAAGGFLGLGSISAVEKAVLQDLESSLK